MLQPAQRPGAVFVLLALLTIAAFSGCSSNTNSTAQKATATSAPRATATIQPTGTPTPGGTPPPTATPVAACSGAITDISVPSNAAQIGPVGMTGATINCAYRIPQDLQTLDTFFKTQMGKDHWTFLRDDAEGPLGFVQEYFKAQRFATITLTQHQSDMHTTDVTISVETSQ